VKCDVSWIPNAPLEAKSGTISKNKKCFRERNEHGG
jgi:hypothetical protein